MKDIAIFGAGGFGREIACLLRQINISEPIWNFVGFFDDGIAKGSKNEYGEILGGTSELNSWQSDLSIVVAISSPDVIKNVITKITNSRITFPNIIAPTVLFLDRESVIMGRGNIFCNNCIISCNTTFGDFNLFNGCIPIGHDTKIGSYNVIMPS
ncbi:MAG: serine acetyltransferase, partial [Alistipes sp.]